MPPIVIEHTFDYNGLEVFAVVGFTRTISFGTRKDSPDASRLTAPRVDPRGWYNRPTMERASALETDLYDQDFALWVKAQVDALRSGRLSAVDIENVTEELEALAKRDRREIKNRLRVLAAHLLKRPYQPEKASRSWDATILEQGSRISSLLEDSPSLRREMPDFFLEAYFPAARLASAETGLTPVRESPDDAFISEWCDAVGELDSKVYFDTRRKFQELREEREQVPPRHAAAQEREPEA